MCLEDLGMPRFDGMEIRHASRALSAWVFGNYGLLDALGPQIALSPDSPPKITQCMCLQAGQAGTCLKSIHHDSLSEFMS